MSSPSFLIKTIPVLETVRLLLRPYSYHDAPGLFALFTDEQVIKAFGYRMEPTLNAARQIIDRWKQEFDDKTGIRWAIIEKSSGNMVGNIGMKDIRAYHQCGAIGYAVLPGHWRKGIATEAMDMVLEYVFGTMDLHRIEAVTFLYNEASQALLRKLGFDLEGLLKSYYKFDGSFHDSYLFARINERH